MQTRAPLYCADLRILVMLLALAAFAFAVIEAG
jgi:hypothetical protein